MGKWVIDLVECREDRLIYMHMMVMKVQQPRSKGGLWEVGK